MMMEREDKCIEREVVSCVFDDGCSCKQSLYVMSITCCSLQFYISFFFVFVNFDIFNQVLGLSMYIFA